MSSELAAAFPQASAEDAIPILPQAEEALGQAVDKARGVAKAQD